jgi:hypothetical protein
MILDRYRGHAWPGQPDLSRTPDGSWAAQPGNDLGHDDMRHFVAAVVQVQRMHPVLRD